jgi:hypothetical protein
LDFSTVGITAEGGVERAVLAVEGAVAKLVVDQPGTHPEAGQGGFGEA